MITYLNSDTVLVDRYNVRYHILPPNKPPPKKNKNP